MLIVLISAAAVNHILCQPRNINDHVSFFFCEYDNAQSLKSRTVLGCLIRQCLSADTLPKALGNILRDLFNNTFPDAEDLEPLLHGIANTSNSIALMIDGLDECTEPDRKLILKLLQRLISSHPSSVKIFISSREDIIRDIARTFAGCRELTMSHSDARSDILVYVNDIVAEKIENEELVVGNPELVQDVRKALIEGANGM